MQPVLLVAAPPYTAPLWADVAARLQPRADVRSVELLTAAGHAPTVDGQADHLAALAAECPRAPVLVAHGLACPAAMRAASAVPGCRLVLCNGPLVHLDPVTRALARAARVPGLLPALLLRPPVILGWLSSSLGLRRAVRNPYVMDRDTVVAVCGPLFATPERRRAVAAYLGSLPAAVRSTPVLADEVTLLWGDEDVLYPPWQLDDARAVLPSLRHVAVPGGRSLHPVERPWLVADAIADLFAAG